MVSSLVVPAPLPASSGSQHNKLRTYVVLTAKSSRGRLASFTDDSSSASTSAASSPTSSPSTSPLRSLRKSVVPDPVIPAECLAYESYAAVASRFPAPSSASPTRDLRWSDICRPLVHTNAKSMSQKARRRVLRRRSASGNDHLECHAMELCFEFLDLADLGRATAVCSEFRDVIQGSGRLITAIYAREWRANVRLPRAYATLAFAPALEMLQARRRDVPYALSTRSQVTTRADQTCEILNNSLLRVVSRGAVDSVRGVHALAAQPSARALGRDVSYFEVAMDGCGSVGLVSLTDNATRRAYGYGSDQHVGWTGVSCGYHGNDGDFVYNNGAAPHGGEWAPYGPSWGVRKTEDAAAVSTVGCGLDMATRRVFFTLNGRFLGFAPFTLPEGEYAAAVSLHEFNDRAVLNAGSAPFSFDFEGFCASL